MIDACTSNPFSTKFVNAGRLAFVGFGEDQLDRLAQTFIQQNGNGQIVGRHGVGKTTLTFEIEKRVLGMGGSTAGFRFVRKTLGARGAVRSGEAVNHAMKGAGFREDGFLNDDGNSNARPAKTVLVLDGIERLSWFQRLALIKSCQRKRIGLFLTSHRFVWGVPALVELEPDLKRFESVVETLTSGCQLQLSPERLAEIFAENDGNMREALMSCYDEFEASRARTDC